jgi:capsular exopolysaccharide synthesis family protein
MSIQPRSISQPQIAESNQYYSGNSLQFFSPKPSDKPELDLKKIWDVVRRRKFFVGTVATILFTTTMAWSITRKPIYMSTFRILIEPEKNAKMREAHPLIPTDIMGGSSVNFMTLTQVLKSSRVIQPLYDSLLKDYPTLTLDEFFRGLSVNRIRETEILEISYLDQDPNRGLAIAERLSKTYLDYGREVRSRNLQQGIGFVDKQLTELFQRVDQIQGKLEAFRRSNQIVNPEDRAAYLTQLAGGIETEQRSVQAKLAEARGLYAKLRQQVGSTPEAAIAASALSESKTFQALRLQLQEIETQISTMSQRLTPDSPPLQALQQRREGIVEQLQRESQKTLQPTGMQQAAGNLSGALVDLNRQLVVVSNEINALEAKNRSLIASAREVQSGLGTIPALVRQNVNLQRELKVANDSLDRFLASRENLQVEVAQNDQPWQMIATPAQRPAPVFPTIPQTAALGLIGSALLSILAGMLVDKLDDVLYSADDLKQGVKFPLLSVIPFYRNVADLSLPAISSLRHVSASDQITQTFAVDLSEEAAIFREAFRSLYLNISVLNPTNPVHSIVVTSALASDGKSTVSLNMALAAAIMGQRVLIVDADLYRSNVHRKARVSNEQGLSQCLTDRMPARDLIQRSPLDNNLFVLSAGTAQSDASRLLSSATMKQVMEDLRDDYDLIIYDAPPVLGFSDSLILTGNTDGSIVVVGLGNTGRTALVEALQSLQLAGNPVLGVVANCLKPGAHLAHKYHEYVRRNYNADITETL